METYLRKLLEGKVNRVIGGIRQMATKRELSDVQMEQGRGLPDLLRGAVVNT